MNPSPFPERDATPLRDWWRAEARGDEAAAEAALFELFGGLPELVPSRSFAARVVAASGRVRSVDPRLRWLGRCFVLVALMAAGASLLVVVPLLGLLPRVAPGISAEGLAGVLSWWVGPLEVLLAFGRLAESLGGAVATAARTPQVGLFVLLALVLGWTAFRSLGRLLLDTRSVLHVH